MPAPGDNVTLLLAQLREGTQDAANQLIPLIYAELRRMAGAYMQRERPGQNLQATTRVHEAYRRLVIVRATAPRRQARRRQSAEGGST